MNALRALETWTYANRTLSEEERRKCRTILEASPLDFSGFAVDEGKRRFPDPKTFSMFLVDQKWWFDHELCGEHGIDFCQPCKPRLITNYVVFSTGSSDRYHCDRDCSGLINGQERCYSPAPIVCATVREAKNSGRDACRMCRPPEENFTEEYEG